MSAIAQPTRWDEDTSTLRRLAELIRRPRDGAREEGNVQSRSLLARLAFRGMLEEGRSEAEIADAFGLDAEQVRTLSRAMSGD
jgi:predicted transposase YdaD